MFGEHLFQNGDAIYLSMLKYMLLISGDPNNFMWYSAKISCNMEPLFYGIKELIHCLRVGLIKLN